MQLQNKVLLYLIKAQSERWKENNWFQGFRRIYFYCKHWGERGIIWQNRQIVGLLSVRTSHQKKVAGDKTWSSLAVYGLFWKLWVFGLFYLLRAIFCASLTNTLVYIFRLTFIKQLPFYFSLLFLEFLGETNISISFLFRSWIHFLYFNFIIYFVLLFNFYSWYCRQCDIRQSNNY